MPLKKPGELFGAITPKEPSINVDDKFPHIKEEFNKVEELRKQIDTVSSSLNNSLTEVVDKNLNFLSNEYSEQLDKFNKRINTFKEEINFEVHNLKKSNQYLKTEIEIVEQRQNRINIPNIKEEVIKEVQNLLSGDVADNIQRLEEKIEVVRNSYQQTLNEGLLNEPPNVQNSDPLTPLDKDYVTLKEFQAQYKIFLNRIQQQLATVGGGGAVRIQDLDDVDLSSAKVNGKYLKYNSTTNKWEGADATGGGGSGITTANVSTNALNVVGLSTHRNGINVAGLSYLDGDVSFVGANTNALWDKSKSDLVLYDSTRLTLGSSEDFQIWHGTNSHIKNSTGSLRIRGDEIMLKRADDSEKYLLATKNEDVKLFYNNDEKFATTNTGATVTGSVTATSFIGDGSALTGIVGSGSGVIIKDGGSTVGTAGTINFGDNLSVTPISAGIVTVTGSAGSGSTANVSTRTLNVVGVTTHNQDVQFPGAAYNILWDQATSKFKFDDSAQCVFGSASGGDMKLFHASGNSTIRNETGQFRIAGNDIRLQTQNHSEDYIICTDGADVKLFYNDAQKFATSNTGISVTGDVEVSDTIFVANNIKHTGDTDTYVEFTADKIRLIAGGKALIHAEEASIDTVIINDGSNDLDFRVEGQNDEHLIFSDGSTDRVGIGSAIPTQKLDVDGNVKATTYYGDGSNLTGISAGTGLATRATNSSTTGSLAQTASGNIDITTQGKTFSLLKVSINAPAWVVLYVDAASRTADASRSEGVDPAPGSGVITEVSTTDAGDSVFLMSPGVIGWNNDSTPTAKVYAKVTNKRSSSGSNTITVTLTNLKLEA